MLRYRFLVCVLATLTYVGCSSKSNEASAANEASAVSEGAEATADQTARGARAEFESAPSVALTGQAKFEPASDGVLAIVTIANATPGKHGIHVHEKGDCSDIPGKSMGSHLAPADNPHGLPEAPAHHLGDMGNIDVTDKGEGRLEFVIKHAALDSGPNSLLGKALVIHEKEDIGTGPSGESGTPIACAVIQGE